MAAYKIGRVEGGIVWANPVNGWGAPYVNQWIPLRRASWWERIAFVFGHLPTSRKD